MGEITRRYTDVGGLDTDPQHIPVPAATETRLLQHSREIALITPLPDGQGTSSPRNTAPATSRRRGPDPERIPPAPLPSCVTRNALLVNLRPAAYCRRDPHRLPDPRRTVSPDAEFRRSHPEERDRQLGQSSPGGHRPGPAGLSPGPNFRPLSEWRSGAR